jgi:hypothetical protein
MAAERHDRLDTVPSEGIYTPRLFPRLVVLQPEFKIATI